MISEWNLWNLYELMHSTYTYFFCLKFFLAIACNCTIGLLYLPSHNITSTRGVKSKIND